MSIEAAQFESTVASIGDRVVQAQIEGPFIPIGNRQAGFVAQGVYRCSGDDCWIAISVPDQTTLDAFCAATGLDAALATDHDAFDLAITEFTTMRSADELAEQLQAVGVPAAIVAKAADVLADAHLASIDNWTTVDQPEVGDFIAPVAPISLSATPVKRPAAAPTLGQHNHQVLAQAGFTPSEISELDATNIIVTEPPS